MVTKEQFFDQYKELNKTLTKSGLLLLHYFIAAPECLNNPQKIIANDLGKCRATIGRSIALLVELKYIEYDSKFSCKRYVKKQVENVTPTPEPIPVKPVENVAPTSEPFQVKPFENVSVSSKDKKDTPLTEAERHEITKQLNEEISTKKHYTSYNIEKRAFFSNLKKGFGISNAKVLQVISEDFPNVYVGNIKIIPNQNVTSTPVSTPVKVNIREHIHSSGNAILGKHGEIVIIPKIERTKPPERLTPKTKEDEALEKSLNAQMPVILKAAN
jgi:hypothetical protein